MKWTDEELNRLFAQRMSLGDFSIKMKTRGTLVIPPNAITTAELRGDQSRFYPELNAENQVTGGYFG